MTRAAWRCGLALTIALVVAACVPGGGPFGRFGPPPTYAPTSGERLDSPINVAQRRALMGGPARPIVCAKAPRTLRVPGITGPTSSEAEDLARPRVALADYVRRVGETADVFLRTRPADAGAAACALEWLDTWAYEEGLLGRTSDATAQIARAHAVAGLSLAYLKIRDEPSLAAEKTGLVEAWLAALGAAVQHDGASLRAAGGDGQAWLALAAAAAGVASGERALFEWGVAEARAALGATRPTALTPLVLTAELALANGVDLYVADGAALARLVHARIAGLGTPPGFDQPTEPQAAIDMAWAEPYYTRFRDPVLPRWIARFRPMRIAALGGDVTLAFGSRDFIAAR